MKERSRAKKWISWCRQKIEKGKLTQDGVERDKFDITNQIFC